MWEKSDHCGMKNQKYSDVLVIPKEQNYCVHQLSNSGEEDLRRLGFLENRNELLRNPYNNLAMGILFKNLPNII